MTAEIKNFATSENKNYMTVCGLANRENVSFYTATNPKYRANMHKYMNWCWVHGFHSYSVGGDYAFTTYTTMEAMDAAIEDRKSKGVENAEGWEALSDAKSHAKPVINIRDRYDHEWDLPCPKGILEHVEWTLRHEPKLLKFVLQHGLSLDTAFYLAEIGVPLSAYKKAVEELEEKTNKNINDLWLVLDKDGFAQVTPDGEHYVINPNYTAGERNNRVKRIQKYVKEEKAKLADVRRKAVRAIRLEHKLHPLIVENYVPQ